MWIFSALFTSLSHSFRISVDDAQWFDCSACRSFLITVSHSTAFFLQHSRKLASSSCCVRWKEIHFLSLTELLSSTVSKRTARYPRQTVKESNCNHPKFLFLSIFLFFSLLKSIFNFPLKCIALFVVSSATIKIPLILARWLFSFSRNALKLPITITPQ